MALLETLVAITLLISIVNLGFNMVTRIDQKKKVDGLHASINDVKDQVNSLR